MPKEYTTKLRWNEGEINSKGGAGSWTVGTKKLWACWRDWITTTCNGRT